MSWVRAAGAFLLVVALVASACDGGDGETPVSDGNDASAESEAGSSDDTTTTTTRVGVEVLPPVAVGEAADFGNDLLAIVTRVEAAELEARGPRDTAGPGVVVTLELHNVGEEPVDLTGLAINVRYGDGMTPAALSHGAPEPALEGLLEPGERRSGQYGFRVPHDELDSLVVDVHHSAAPNVVLVEVGDRVG